MHLSKRRKLHLCFILMFGVLLVMSASMGYLIYKVATLSNESSKNKNVQKVTSDNYNVQKVTRDTSDENTQSAESLVAGDVDSTDPAKQMSDTQKFFLNIGIRQDHLIQDCVENQLKQSFPNIDYAFFGYDIYRGYPLAESHDPGFTHPIFRADYSQKRQSADCRFSIPNGIIVVSDVSCVTSFSPTTIETKEELQKALAESAKVNGGGFGTSFSASAGYKKATSSISEESSVFVVSTAHCDYYFVKLRRELAPSFDDEFLIWLSKLDKTDDNSTYIDFMDRFGTHFLTGATFGARFTYEHKMTSSYFSAAQNSQYNVAVRARYHGAFSVGGGFSLDREQRDAASEFSKNVQTRTITVGAAPPSNGDGLTWASTVQNNPIPTKYTLEPIENLFIKEYVGNLGIDYETIRENIVRYKDDYARLREKECEESNSSNGTEHDLGSWLTNKQILRVADGGYQGSWGESQFCPPDEYAIGYNLKIEPNQGDGDDTGLNTIRLICADVSGSASGSIITSKQGTWGSFRENDALCPKTSTVVTFLTRFSLQMHDSEHIAASFVTFKCQDLDKASDEIQLEIPPGHGEPWGQYWYTSDPCPVGTAICGIKTKVENPQGENDDTALNDVRFFCCGR